MKAFYSDIFEFPLPKEHRFPIEKYALLRKRIIEDGIIPPDDVLIPKSASDDEILLVHIPEYLQKVNTGKLTDKEIRRLGLPWSSQLVERAKRSTGGTIEACRAALNDGIAFNLSGGTHHAYADHAEGFCLFNDVAIAVRVLQSEKLIKRVVIIDCDVHQGNGTASIFTRDPTVLTFSIHGEKNFPLKKEKSDIDIALQDNTNDEAYLEALKSGLNAAVNSSLAEMAIYVSGADAFVDDQLGRLSLSKDGLAKRDFIVFEHCAQAGLPTATVMAGGYAHNLNDIVDIHIETIKCAIQVFNK
jgi:acetoin utilization deacetylase AcuC-like enzyme